MLGAGRRSRGSIDQAGRVEHGRAESEPNPPSRTFIIWHKVHPQGFSGITEKGAFLDR